MNSVDLYVDYSKKIGLGHVKRSSALAVFLGLKKHQLIKIESSDASVIQQFKECKQSLFSDICIVDSFLLNDSELQILLNYYKHVLLIDDWVYRKIDNVKLGIIDWTIGCDNLKNTDYRKELIKSTFFEGEEFAPLKPYIEDFLVPEKSTINCMVYLGGGVVYQGFELVKSLLNILGDCRVSIVGECLGCDGFDERVTLYPKLNHRKFTGLLEKSNLLICTGGWVMYEALNMGIQVGVIIKDGNSVLDACGALSNNYAIYVGNMENETISVVPSFLGIDRSTFTKFYFNIPEKFKAPIKEEAREKIRIWLGG